MEEVKKRIFVVDDDDSIRLIISRYLEAEGWLVEGFAGGEAALQAFAAKPPDMMILDIMMPGIDGLEVCRKIRAESLVPIIMVSAKDDEVDRIVGLELGSDDYLSKPFSPRELVARVKRVFHRFHVGLAAQQATLAPAAPLEQEGQVLVWRDLKLYPEQRSANCQGAEVQLTTKEFELLQFIARHLNKAFTREQLLQQVFGYDYFGDERAIDDLVKRIRKKLKAAGSQCELKTVWGYGYKGEA